MTRLVLVRHGVAAAGWDADLDPGLSPTGARQADLVAASLATEPPASIITSPLRRARDTAGPLESAWGVSARVEPRVGEIASPTDELNARTGWLRRIMGGCWDDVEDPDGELSRWRQGVLDAMTALADDTVVFSHFIAINVAVGAAIGDDRVVCFAPDNASRTVLESVDGSLRLVSLGVERQSDVQAGLQASLPK